MHLTYRSDWQEYQRQPLLARHSVIDEWRYYNGEYRDHRPYPSIRWYRRAVDHRSQRHLAFGNRWPVHEHRWSVRVRENHFAQYRCRIHSHVERQRAHRRQRHFRSRTGPRRGVSELRIVRLADRSPKYRIRTAHGRSESPRAIEAGRHIPQHGWAAEICQSLSV